MKILVFDTETTGLPKKVWRKGKAVTVYPRMVQLAWILYDADKQKMLGEHNYIIRLPDGMLIPEQSTAIHNITNEMMFEQGVDIQEAFSMFRIHLEKADYIVAHNIDFDTNVLVQEFERNGYTNLFDIVPKSIHYCTMKEGTQLCNILRRNPVSGKLMPKWPTLNELHKCLFNTSLDNLHDAYHDVLVCLRCFYKMIYDEDILTKNKRIHKTFDQTFSTSEKSSDTSQQSETNCA